MSSPDQPTDAQASSSHRFALSSGERLDERYEIVRPIGAGGFGEVYEATHVTLGHAVALKLLHTPSSEMKERFEREARITAQLRHPNMCATNDFGVCPEGPYMVMELLRGRSLAEELERRAGSPFPWRSARRVAIGAGSALDAAHERDVIHRDIKPSNIFITGREPVGVSDVRILDFGIAKELTTGDHITHTGSIFGTPAFMAPEVLLHQEPATKRSDIYAFGATLFTLLSGRAPYAPPLGNIVEKMLRGSPPAPSLLALRQDVPAPFADVIERAMSLDPSERYASVAELLVDLHRVSAAEPIAQSQVGVANAKPSTRPKEPRTTASVQVALDVLERGPPRELEPARSKRPTIRTHVAATEEVDDLGGEAWIDHPTRRVSAFETPAGLSKRVLATVTLIGAVLGAGLVGVVLAAFGAEQDTPAADSRTEVMTLARREGSPSAVSMIESANDGALLPMGADPSSVSGVDVAAEAPGSQPSGDVSDEWPGEQTGSPSMSTTGAASRMTKRAPARAFVDRALVDRERSSTLVSAMNQRRGSVTRCLRGFRRPGSFVVTIQIDEGRLFVTDTTLPPRFAECVTRALRDTPAPLETWPSRGTVRFRYE